MRTILSCQLSKLKMISASQCFPIFWFLAPPAPESFVFNEEQVPVMKRATCGLCHTTMNLLRLPKTFQISWAQKKRILWNRFALIEKQTTAKYQDLIFIFGGSCSLRNTCQTIFIGDLVYKSVGEKHRKFYPTKKSRLLKWHFDHRKDSSELHVLHHICGYSTASYTVVYKPVWWTTHWRALSKPLICSYMRRKALNLVLLRTLDL